jgi:hypothetical protein
VKAPVLLAATTAALLTLAANAARGETPETLEAAAEDEIVLRYPPSSVRWGLAVGGVVATGLAYGLSAMCATIWPEEDVPGADALYAPVVGPWISLARNGCAADNPDCDASRDFRGFMLVFSGVVQAVGLGLVAESIFLTTEAEPPDKGAGLRVVPSAGPGSGGVVAVGTF